MTRSIMAIYYEDIPESLIQWILEQKLFWVATAPLSGQGHVNVSPKGGDKFFGVPDRKTFWYMEMSGSGIETISHIYEPGNGRVTILFSAFEGPPRILRLYGTGRTLERGTQEYDEWVEKYNVQTLPGSRSIIIVDVHQAGTSCGFSVPFYDFKEFRQTLNDFYERKEKKYLEGNEQENIDRYWAYKNAWSIDGLPGMKTATQTAKKKEVAPIKKLVGAYATPAYRSPSDSFSLEQVVIIFLVAFIAGALAATLSPTLLKNSNMSIAQQMRSFVSKPL